MASAPENSCIIQNAPEDAAAHADATAELLSSTVPAEFKADVPLTDAERAKLEAFKAAAAAVPMSDGDRPYWTTEHALKRFLVARKWNGEVALKMYTETMAFRASNRCCELLATYQEPPAMRKYFPWGFAGTDKEGFAVLVERVGTLDLTGIQHAVGIDDFLRWVMYYHEVQERAMRSLSAKAGRDRHKMTCIIDMKGLGFRHMSPTTLAVLKRRTRLEEDNYPEVVKRVFLINTPGAFSAVWGLVKHFMDEGTVDKLQILGSNYLPTLLRYMDASAIPQALGGTLVDAHGDAECRSLVCPGGMVAAPYLTGVAGDGLGCGEEVSVSAGKHTDVLLRVPAGATVGWRWATLDKDVTFSVAVVPAAAAAASAGSGGGGSDGGDASPGLLHVTRSVCGVHQLVPGYAGPVAKAAHVHSAGDAAAPIPGAAPGAKPELAVPPARLEKLFGSYTVPPAAAAAVGAAGEDPGESSSLVRLRWDNGASWMHSKTLVRRVDVLLPRAALPARPTAASVAAAVGVTLSSSVDVDVASAAAARVVGPGAGQSAAEPAPAAAADAAAAAEAAVVLVEEDPADAFALRRLQHMVRFGL